MFFTGIRRVGLIFLLALGSTSARATPITYAFSGTFDQPYQGSSQFSGTFTYDTDLPLNPNVQPYPGWSYYSGVPADPTEPVLSLTFQAGNVLSSSLGRLENDELIVTHTQGGDDGFYIEEQFLSQSSSGGSVLASLGMVNNNLIQRGPFTSTSPPTSLNLSDFSMGAQLNLTIYGNGTEQTYMGTITSLVPEAATPEPASLLIFGALAVSIWRFRPGGSRRCMG